MKPINDAQQLEWVKRNLAKAEKLARKDASASRRAEHWRKVLDDMKSLELFRGEK